MTVIGYPTPGKAKARYILDAFCAGGGGHVADEIPPRLLPGAVAFYGVTDATAHLWRQAREEGRDVYYLDNAYFDRARETYFRVTLNALQHHGRGVSDGARFAALDIPVRPWRADALSGPGFVLVCPQSAQFMRVCAEYAGDWCTRTVEQLRRVTGREVRVRPWMADKRAWFADFREALRGCWCVVVYSSSSANVAMLHGVPAICTATDCVARPLAGVPLDQVDRPPLPDGRLEWARVAADNQWTLEEMRNGLAWNALQRQSAARRAAA